MAIAHPRSESEPTPAPLRVVFMGTPAIAARILERLIEDAGDAFHVVGVVTRGDRPRGRGLKLEPSEVGAVAARHSLPTLKPVKIKTDEFLAELRQFDPDVLAVAAYGRILPPAVLSAPRVMPLNVHASLLPRHRGAAPIEGAILAGDAQSGVTIMRIVEKMDAGPMILQKAIPLASDETQGTLKGKLAELGADALVEVLHALARGEGTETPQDESLATYTRPVEKADSVIDWQAAAAQIERLVRAYDPWPVARTRLDGNEMLVWRAAVEDAESRGDAGAILSLSPNVIVQCGKGRLRLIELQAAGRKRMAAADLIRGRRIAVGHRLGR